MFTRGLSRIVSAHAKVLFSGGNASKVTIRVAGTNLIKSNIHNSAALFKTYFAESHEWVADNKDGTVTIGISSYAQAQLGDIVYVDLPELDKEIEAGGEIATVESVKAASDIYSPVSGSITEVNGKLEDEPEMINRDAMGDGWIAKIKVSDPEKLDNLLNEEQYDKLVKELGN